MELLTQAYSDPDLQLVECIKRGDETAFQTLLRKYQDNTYNLAYRLLGNHRDAEVVALQTWLRVHDQIHSFQEGARVLAWIHGLTAAILRERMEAGASPQPVPDPAIPGSSNALTDDVLQDCLSSLPVNARLAFVLRMCEGCDYDTIAEISGVPWGTVKSRLNKARQLLRTSLKSRGML